MTTDQIGALAQQAAECAVDAFGDEPEEGVPAWDMALDFITFQDADDSREPISLTLPERLIFACFYRHYVNELLYAKRPEYQTSLDVEHQEVCVTRRDGKTLIIPLGEITSGDVAEQAIEKAKAAPEYVWG